MAIPVNKVVRMRASPAVGIGGMYATGEGLDQAVQTAPTTPPFIDRQNWRIEDAGSGPAENKVCIVFQDNAYHVPWVWGFDGERPNPEAPIVLTSVKDKQVVWALQPADNGIENAYTLLAEIGIVGAAWYAGTNGNQVVFVPLPIGAPAESKPYWVIAPVN